VQSLARNGYTEVEVLDALRGRHGTREVSFRYDLLDAENAYLGQLDNVITGSISQSSLADIKRTATFTLRENGQINYLRDRIQPWVRLRMPHDPLTTPPPAEWNGHRYVEFPQGVFLLTSPVRSSDAANTVLRQVEAYDTSLVLLDDGITNRQAAVAGDTYTATVDGLLGSIPANITQSPLTLPTAREWEPGTAKLTVINDLLTSINYEALFFDEYGRAVARPYVSPTDRGSEYTYADDAMSVTLPEVQHTLDLYGVANKWVLTVNNPDRPPLSATLTNNDPNSPTSVIGRGRTILDFRPDQDAANLATLIALTKRLAVEASQVYESVTFSTALMPHHSHNDVFTFRFNNLGLSQKYAETEWTMTLEAGTPMTHTVRRVVNIELT
jgi:hypothetical protein